MSRDGATPRPWRVAPAHEYADGDLNVDAKDKGFVCAAGKHGDAEAEANAALIVRAVNAHEENVRLRDAAHRLAMLALQSERYAEDGEYAEAVRAVFDIVGTVQPTEGA